MTFKWFLLLDTSMIIYATRSKSLSYRQNDSGKSPPQIKFSRTKCDISRYIGYVYRISPRYTLSDPRSKITETLYTVPSCSTRWKLLHFFFESSSQINYSKLVVYSSKLQKRPYKTRFRVSYSKKCNACIPIQ